MKRKKAIEGEEGKERDDKVLEVGKQKESRKREEKRKNECEQEEKEKG